MYMKSIRGGRAQGHEELDGGKMMHTTDLGITPLINGDDSGLAVHCKTDPALSDGGSSIT